MDRLNPFFPLIIAGLVFLLLLFLDALVLHITAIQLCNHECERLGGTTSRLIESGNWRIDDTCVCYKEVHVATFELEDVLAKRSIGG